MGRKSSYRRDSGPRIHQCNPRSRLPTLNATIHRYQTRYQPGSLKSNRSSRHKTCLWRTLTVGEESICYLFFSTNYFSTPPGGMSKQKKSFTLYRNSSLENRLEQALIPNRGSRFEVAGSSR